MSSCVIRTSSDTSVWRHLSTVTYLRRSFALLRIFRSQKHPTMCHKVLSIYTAKYNRPHFRHCTRMRGGRPLAERIVSIDSSRHIRNNFFTAGHQNEVSMSSALEFPSLVIATANREYLRGYMMHLYEVQRMFVKELQHYWCVLNWKLQIIILLHCSVCL